MVWQSTAVFLLVEKRRNSVGECDRRGSWLEGGAEEGWAL